jgi:hypothetical protein
MLIVIKDNLHVIIEKTMTADRLDAAFLMNPFKVAPDILPQERIGVTGSD